MNEEHPRSAEEIRRHFDFFDDDKNGFIDFEEYRDMLDILGHNIANPEAEDGFAEIDSNRDGQISFDEFIAWWREVWHDD